MAAVGVLVRVDGDVAELVDAEVALAPVADAVGLDGVVRASSAEWLPGRCWRSRAFCPSKWPSGQLGHPGRVRTATRPVVEWVHHTIASQACNWCARGQGNSSQSLPLAATRSGARRAGGSEPSGVAGQRCRPVVYGGYAATRDAGTVRAPGTGSVRNPVNGGADRIMLGQRSGRYARFASRLTANLYDNPPARLRPLDPPCAASPCSACSRPPPSFAAEPPKAKKIVLIAGPLDGAHPAGTHEYEKTVRAFKYCLEHASNVTGVRVEAHLQGWPDKPGDARRRRHHRARLQRLGPQGEPTIRCSSAIGWRSSTSR